MRNIKKNSTIYLFVLPAILYLMIFIFYPLFRGMIISFQKYGIGGSNGFVGFENYINVIKDKTFITSVVNTLMISFGILIIGFSFPILVALGLNQITNKYFKKFSQSIVYIPHLLSWVVILGLWMNILSTDGIINSFLKNFGVIDKSITFFSKESFARPLIVLMTIWKDMGYTSIIYLASLVTINPNLYEAADIDGATMIHKVRYIILPHLVPTMKVVFLITLMGVLRTFDSVFIMSNGMIADKIRTAIVYTYEKGILKFDLGLATAGAILIFLGTMFFTVLTKKIIKYND
ncbi:sugar ABC transporter permease [Clostridium oceanicum]|uniref:Sugar ABC transporter permease n=1 Tax=Clostridium oceanicum TaxID=1543 RepID=A0ABP3UEY8_9CLOT